MSYRTEKYGRYDIRSGPLGTQWGAHAYRGKVLVARKTAASREDAVAALRTELEQIDGLEISGRDAEGAPSAKVYEEAFLIVLPQVSDPYRNMLKAHFEAPDFLISATKLAEAAGYESYGAANLHYGKLGKLIATETDFTPPKRANGTEIWTCAIARDPALDTEFPQTSLLEAVVRNMDTGHFEWQMRPQVVEALKALGFR